MDTVAIRHCHAFSLGMLLMPAGWARSGVSAGGVFAAALNAAVPQHPISGNRNITRARRGACRSAGNKSALIEMLRVTIPSVRNPAPRPRS